MSDVDRGCLEAALSEVLARGVDRDLEVGLPATSGHGRSCQVAIRALSGDDVFLVLSAQIRRLQVRLFGSSFV